MYPTRIALNCLARTSCINTANTARSMQQVGLAFALEPALRWLYPAPADLLRALARYAGHSNTHPFMAPLFVGILLSLEEGAAKGALPPANLGLVRETLATSLSALGDAFFSGTLLPLWALLSVALLLAGHTGLMAGLTLTLFLTLLLFRAASFAAGLRYGMAVLAGLRRLNLINWVNRLKMVNAVLTALVIWRLLPSDARAFPWTGYVLGALAVLTAAWLVGRRRLPRPLLWALTLGVLILMDAGLIGM